MIKSCILIFTNGDVITGFGHLSRSLVLANVFRDNNHHVIFLIKKSSPFSEKMRNEGYEVFLTSSFDENETVGVIQEIENTYKIKIAVVDLVEKEYDRLSWLRERSPKLFIVSFTLFLFDLKKRYEHLSFFPSLKSSNKQQLVGKYGEFKLLSGKDYFAFRKEFKDIEREQQKFANRILITMGGTDPYDLTLKVLKSILNSRYKITIILSSLSSGYEKIKKLCDNNPTADIIILNGTNNIADKMCNNDIIILNGGLTRYEACLTKTPFIAVSIHEQQYEITKQLTDFDVGVNLGIGSKLNSYEVRLAISELLENQEKRIEMSKNMRNLIDADGDVRIYCEIISAYKFQFYEENY